MEVVGQMVSGVAHDLANILTAIQGFAELAADMAAEPARGVIQEIRATADRGTDLTRKLLAVGRARDSRAVPLDLNDCVAEVEALLRRVVGPDLVVQTRLDTAIPRVNAIQSDVEMVLLNLVLNARDAVSGSGWIEISTRVEAPSAGDRWPHVVLSVADSGVGMDEETLARVFEPFFTTKDEGVGTGLGLAVVADVIRDLGGRIAVESAPGRGTTFTLRIPAPEGLEAHPSAPLPVAAAGGSETLLLCDDDPGVVRMLASALRRVGYEVIETHGPHEAIAQFHDREGDVDLLVTDVMMPDLTGEDLLAQLRMGRPDLPAVLLTGYTQDGLEAQGVDLAEGRLLQKPFGPEQLRTVVREVLDARASRR
jgi:CheY-like chemotaxis protein/two-component sensor histidine kinase